MTGRVDELADLAAVKGLVSHAEGVRLAQLAEQVPADEAIVELGAFKGKSTSYLAAGARRGHGAHVYSVDLWTLGGQRKALERYSAAATFAAYRKQTQGLAVTPIRGRSDEVGESWSRPVGLLFIDADHSFAGCLADFIVWSRHVAPGGAVAFHDYDPRFPGVVRVVDRYLGDRWDAARLVDRLASVTRR